MGEFDGIFDGIDSVNGSTSDALSAANELLAGLQENAEQTKSTMPKFLIGIAGIVILSIIATIVIKKMKNHNKQFK